jgi:hypothetical protein
VGKRSSFARKPRDFYPTPFKAVEPLLPFLRRVQRFAEPCEGKGDLVRHLEQAGLKCVYRGDMHRGKNALARDNYGRIDAIITNPPHTRDVMHKLIWHFQYIAPTWLLIDLDWAANEHAVPYLPCCSDIVVIGRVKWIENSAHTGKENYGWYRFSALHRNGPRLHNRRGL